VNHHGFAVADGVCHIVGVGIFGLNICLENIVVK
jgi:hypothetical protein